MSERKLETIQPGERVRGTVTSVELAGAFVDIGVQVPGFLHISRLQPGKVNRVEEVLAPGQSVELWVSRVDPIAQRLELSMIRPITLKWGQIQPGMQLQGEVIRIESFGAFVEVGAERPGLVHVSEISDEYVRDPRDQLRVGQELAVTVLEVDRKKKQIRLSLKAAQPEEEVELEEEQQLPTAMELALRQALEAAPPNRSPGKRKAKPGQPRNELEDILSRTLSSRLRTSNEEPEDEK